jgi:hypothetical protein
MSIKNVRKWYREFSNGRTNIHDKARSGRPSVSDNLQEQVESELREDRRVTVRELEEMLQIPKSSIHRIISDLGYRKCSARWLPKMLTEDHKRQRIESSCEVLELYAEEGAEQGPPLIRHRIVKRLKNCVKPLKTDDLEC